MQARFRVLYGLESLHCCRQHLPFNCSALPLSAISHLADVVPALLNDGNGRAVVSRRGGRQQVGLAVRPFVLIGEQYIVTSHK